MNLYSEEERERTGRKRTVCKTMVEVEQERRHREEGRVGTGIGDKRRKINCMGECVGREEEEK